MKPHGPDWWRNTKALFRNLRDPWLAGGTLLSSVSGFSAWVQYREIPLSELHEAIVEAYRDISIPIFDFIAINLFWWLPYEVGPIFKDIAFAYCLGWGVTMRAASFDAQATVGFSVFHRIRTAFSEWGYLPGMLVLFAFTIGWPIFLIASFQSRHNEEQLEEDRLIGAYSGRAAVPLAFTYAIFIGLELFYLWTNAVLSLN